MTERTKYRICGNRLVYAFILAAFALPGIAISDTTPDRQVSLMGKEWLPLDREGVFVALKSSFPKDAALPEPYQQLQQITPQTSRKGPLVCRLVDYIDATVPQTHHFRDDGGSRVLELPCGRFRVTAAPKGFELKWFAYDIQTANYAGRGHLLVAELANDRERYTTLTLTTPRSEPWSPPYRGEEKVKVDSFQLSQEPLWYEPDVGLDIYTGRELPLDNKPFLVHFIFFPKTARVKLTVSSSGWAQPVRPNNGAAVRHIWIFEITGRLADHFPAIDPPPSRPQRHIGVYTTHPWYYLAHYGVPPHTAEQRRQSLENMCDLMAFCGLNLLQFNAINGSDRAGRAWYPGSYYSNGGPDMLSELPPIAASRNIDLIPVLTSITAPGKIHGDKPNQYGFSELSFQKPANPNSDPRAFNQRAPDPLRPETQQWLIRHLCEIARRCKTQNNVIGIGFRVNGKIGTCYISGEDKTGKQIRVVPAEEVGYSAWDLQEFRRSTGLNIPTACDKAYAWLKSDRQRWEKWLDFRCRRTHEFWLTARDAIQAIRADWNLYVLTDLPSEVLASNIIWPGKNAPQAQKITLDLLRTHGYDPRLYKNDKGIIIQRVMMVDMERFFSKWGPPFGSNPLRYRQFHEQPFLAKWYRTCAGSAVELYHTYWEEPFHPDGEFGPDKHGFGLRTATATAAGRAFYRPATIALLNGNNETLVFTGWQRPVLGHEDDMRHFAQAFRALPVGNTVVLKTIPASTYLQAAWYGNRIGVINTADKTVTATILLDRKLQTGSYLQNTATKATVPLTNHAGVYSFKATIQPYDLQTFIVQ